MKQNRINGIRVGSSDHTGRMKELRDNHRQFQEMLANGWRIESIRTKRPRITKPKTPKEVFVSIFGGKVKMTFAEYKQHGDGLKVLMEIF